MLDGKIGRYDSNNLQFRRAYIKERLLELKTERDALVAERDALAGMIAAASATAIRPGKASNEKAP